MKKSQITVCTLYMTYVHVIHSLYNIGAMAVALGTGAAGTYSTSNSLWELLHQVISQRYNMLMYNTYIVHITGSSCHSLYTYVYTIISHLSILTAYCTVQYYHMYMYAGVHVPYGF